jgi:hypothetical protein
MRRKLLLAALVAAAAAGPAVAQQAPEAGGIRTETQRRMAQGDRTTDALNWLGLIGLLGLAGLKRGHDEDSYHPAPID